MSKTKNCHYIPQVYLMSWKNANNNHNVNVYDKEKKQLVKDGFNIKNNFVGKNLYNYKLFDDFQTIKYEEEVKKDIIEKIKKFEKDNNIYIYYQGQRLKYNKDDNYIFLTEKDSIDFKKQKSSSICCKKERNIYMSELKKIKSTFIEDLLYKKVENNWNEILKLLKDVSKNFFNNSNLKEIPIHYKYMHLLINMITLMIYRIPNTPGDKEYNDTIESSILALVHVLEKPIFSDNTVDDNTYKEKICKPVKKFAKYRLKKDVYDILMRDSIDKNEFIKENRPFLEMFVIRNKNDLEFYTSDVPCFIVENRFEVSNKNNAIYFPITDKILLRLKKSNQLVDKINIYEANDREVRYFNNLIYNKADKYIIFKNKWRN